MKTGVAVTLLFLSLSAFQPPRSTENLNSLFWRISATGPQSRGIEPLSGADGISVTATRGGVACLAVQPASKSLYLYFRVAADPPTVPLKPLYVIVEYFDEQPGLPLTLQYDSAIGDDLPAKFHEAEDRSGGYGLGSGQWKTAIFLLKQPKFAHRQNLGADFRLAGAHLAVRSLRLSTDRPLTWDQVDRIDAVDVKPLVKIGAGGQLIAGGFDPARVADAGPQSHALEAAVPALQSLGVTSHECYVRWNLCEPKKGQYDWRVYDKYVAIYKKHHLKWVPFLICGSAYSLPDWYYKQPGSQGYVCLEHGQESDVQSLWNPVLRGHVSRFIQAFCQRYRDSGVIESILLGITGNYGEAIYPASGNDWTADIHGPYHTHAGFWAGDPYAVKSWQGWLRQKYSSPATLDAAWNFKSGGFERIRPFLQKDAPNNRAWLDFVAWYTASMTDWARFWLKTTRDNFIHGDIYLCTGGDAPPQHGADFAAQCKAAAEVHGGVRITNEGSDYAANFALTRWVASAGRQYHAYFSFEPASGVTPDGVIARIYNATASGARGLHYYFPNLFESDANRDSFLRWGAQFQQRDPLVEIAVYYPQAYISLHGNDFLSYASALRDRFDFDFVSDSQIADGGLKRYKALILLHGNIAETQTWKSIEDWVRQGGILLSTNSAGRCLTIDGSFRPDEELFGSHAIGRGRVERFPSTGRARDDRDFYSGILGKTASLSPITRAMTMLDALDDNVYVAAIAPNELLWYNASAKQVVKRLPEIFVIPPHAIVSKKPRLSVLPANRQAPFSRNRKTVTPQHP